MGFSSRSLSGFIQGFSVMLVAIWVCNIIALVLAGDAIVASLLFLILLIPVSVVIYTFLGVKKAAAKEQAFLKS